MINNYNGAHYMINSNIINNSFSYFYKCQNEKDIKNVIHYFITF